MDFAMLQLVGIVILTVIVYGGMIAVGMKIYRDQNADELTPEEEFDKYGGLPSDYSRVVKDRAGELLRQSEAPSEESLLPAPAIIDLIAADEALASTHGMRTVRAGILNAGWIKGDIAYHRGDGIERGLSDNPHPKGSEEARQWVRGFCQGYSKREVIDPRPYMEEA